MRSQLTLIAFILCMFYPLTGFNQVDLSKGLMAYYPFNGNANDASGNGNNPVFNNTTLTTDYYGNANRACRFNGIDTYIEIPNSNTLSTGNTISVCAWVKPMGFYYGTCHGNSVLMKGDNDFQTGNYMLRFDDALYTGTNCNGGIPDTVHQTYYGIGTGLSPVQDTPYAQKNIWRSVVYTYDGLHARIYIDCNLILDTEQPGLSFSNGDNLLLGKLNNSQFPYWLNAAIDEVRIYNRALNSDEVKAYSFSCADKQPCSNWLKVNKEISGVQIGNLNISGNKLTVEALINRTTAYPDLYDGGDVVSKHDNPGDDNYLLRPTVAQITTSKGFFETKRACPIELNKTYHIAMVYDGKTLKFYRNGYLMDEVPASGNLYQNDWITKIGTTANVGSPYPADFIGYINEVRIWNVARKQSDIKRYMDQSLPNPASQTGLLAYYTFDDLKNKQGNEQWDASILGDASINQANPTCSSFIADSCDIKLVNVAASFIGPDTGCANTPVQFQNTSTNATNYFWSFCAAGFNTTPQAQNLGNPGNVLNTPVFMDYALDDDGNYYGFVTSYATGKITKLNYGNSLLNAPTATDLGNFGGVIPIYAEGIQVKKSNGKCYVFVVAAGDDDGNGSVLIRLDFGSSFSNTPTINSLGNVGGLLFPHDLFIASENSNFYGFTINIRNNTITRFDFGNDLGNLPNGVNLGSIGNFNYPCGFSFINTGGNWYAFVTNRDNNSITRLNFGSSLIDIPTGINIGNPGSFLNRPRDISIFQSCEGVVGLVVNEEDETTGTITKLDFGDNVLMSPQASDLGNLGSLQFPHSISKFFLEGNDIYSFITNVQNNTITRLQYTGCTSTNIASSTQQTPPLVTYTTPGIYNVNLLVDIGLPTQTSFCKQIVIKNCKSPAPVIASFTGPDTICINTAAQFNNTSVGATNYQWSFCSAFQSDPEGNIMNISGAELNMPVFSDVVLDNGNYYGIVTNHLTGHITRLNFGNSLLNTPTADDLGNFNGIIPSQVEGVQILNVNNRWYVITLGGGKDYSNSDPRIVKLDFGNSLSNIPVATNWGNIGQLDLPIDFYIAKENGNYYGFTMNVYSNTITRFDFGSDFIDAPTGVNLGNIGNLNYPDGFVFINNNSNWYAFAVNAYSNSITKLDFGYSLTNTPTASIINNPGELLSKPRDIAILSICDELYGYVLNADNEMIKLNFGSDINSTPSATNLGNFGGFTFPHSFSDFFSEGNNIYTLVPNVNGNSISAVSFNGCSDISGSLKESPDSIIYNKPGEYTVNLMIDVGLPTQTSFCKQIAVLNCDTICNLQADFKYQQTTCDPKSVQFHSTTLNADSIWWDFDNGKTAGNITDTTIQYAAFGNYVVKLYAKTNAGCFDTAEYIIDVNVVKDSAIINNDTAVCAGSKVQLMGADGLDYCWSPSAGLSATSIQNPFASPPVTTKYYLHLLKDSSKPVIMDSVTITIIYPPDVSAGNDVSVCKGDSVQLSASGAVKYNWNASAYLSDTTIAAPLATPSESTSFVVTGYNAQGCADKDTVDIFVLPLPEIVLTNDTAVCTGGSVQLQANGNSKNTYNWAPSTGLSNTGIYNPVASPASATKYFVKVTDENNCAAVDSVTVDVLPIPKISALDDTSVCLNSSVALTTNASYANTFTWSPSTGLNNPYIQNPIAAPAVSTLYTVIAGNGICSEKDSVLVSVLPLPDVKASNDTTVCGNASVQLNASGAISYTWSPLTGLSDATIANPVASPGKTATYIVTGTGNNSCTNTDSVNIVVNPPAAFSLTPQNASICLGDSVLLTAGGGDIYSWLPAQDIANASSAATKVFPKQSATYTVTITNSICKVIAVLTSDIVVKDLPAVTVSKSNDIDCLSFQAQLQATGGVSYYWYPSTNISNTHISNPVVNPPSNTKYFVKVTNANGCSDRDSILVLSNTNNSDKAKFEVASAFTPNHDGINDCFSVRYWGPADIFDMSIYNRWGQLVYHSQSTENCWDGEFNGQPQAAGTYVYVIKISTKCSVGVLNKKGTIVLIR